VAHERIIVLNGPNLNLLGRRDRATYGTETLEDVRERLETLAIALECSIDMRQSNAEGTLVDWLHEAWDTADGVVFNPGALAHTSIALRDAVAAIDPPVIEVHISNVHAREAFRQHSTISPVAAGVIVGLGTFGYDLAVRALVEVLRSG
jgi:3-dehydroquinate dehydratase II